MSRCQDWLRRQREDPHFDTPPCTHVFPLVEGIACAHELMKFIRDCSLVLTEARFAPHYCLPQDARTAIDVVFERVLDPLKRCTARQAQALTASHARGAATRRGPTMAERLDMNTQATAPEGTQFIDLTNTQPQPKATDDIDEATLARRNGLSSLLIRQQRDTRAAAPPGTISCKFKQGCGRGRCVCKMRGHCTARYHGGTPYSLHEAAPHEVA